MVDGFLTEPVNIVVTGVMGILGMVGIGMGVWNSVKKARTETKLAEQERVNAAEERGKKETESRIAYENLKRSIDEIKSMLNDRPPCIQVTIRAEQEEHKRMLQEHATAIIELKESAKQIHKRMDEHRKVDHRWPTSKNGEDEQ